MIPTVVWSEFRNRRAPNAVITRDMNREPGPKDGRQAMLSGIPIMPPNAIKNPRIKVNGVTLKLLTGETI